MKRVSFLFCILLFLFACAVPVAASIGLTEEPTEVTEEPTLNPVTPATTEQTTVERTTKPTTEPTTVPTTEKTPVPTATPALVGWVTIASTPMGASVSMDGKALGTTPLAGIEISSGTSHTVKVTMAGYEPYTTSVTVSPGEESAVDATLTPIVTTVPTTEPTPEPTVTIQPIGSDKGWFRINCNINGATASLDNGASGSCTIASGSCSIPVSTTGTPVKSFRVEKGGYTTYTDSVSQMPPKGGTVDLYATLNPVASFGSISVTSSPSAAVATLDGSSWQTTPYTFTSVTAGTSHEIRVSMSGYQSVTRSVFVNSGETAYVSVSLSPNPAQTGSLYVSSSPSGADIYVDGGYIGETPSTVPNLAPGTHSVRLHKAKYNEYVGTVTVSAGYQTPLSITLSPQASNVGSIEVMSTPGGSAVYVDSQYMGTTLTNSYFDITSLTPGYHIVLLRLTDYQDYTQNVLVPAGGSATVNAVLAKVSPGPTPDTTGQVVIASSPTGAEVYIDNVYMGVTPATLTNVAAGSHTLTLRLSGYGDFVQTITVTGGDSTPVAATLVGVEPTATTKSPVTVVPVLGAIMAAGALVLLRRA